MSMSITDDNGVTWHKIPSAKAFSTFSSFHMVLVAETRMTPEGKLEIVNDNWVKTLRGNADIYHTSHYVTAKRLREVCAVIRQRISIGRLTCLSVK